MKTKWANLAGGVSLACLLATGCSIEPETLETLREVVQSHSAEPGDTILSVSSPANLQFDPPHPDRIDPFTYPSGAASSADGPGTSITTAAQVDVLGFADVGGPRVFLRTKDTVKLMAVGDQADGVEVIAIHPPTVDLRMGSLDWRATMYDDLRTQRD